MKRYLSSVPVNPVKFPGTLKHQEFCAFYKGKSLMHSIIREITLVSMHHGNSLSHTSENLLRIPEGAIGDTALLNKSQKRMHQN